MHARRWTAHELKVLLKYPDEGTRVGRELPGRSEDSITSMAGRLRLRVKDPRKGSKHPWKIGYAN